MAVSSLLRTPAVCERGSRVLPAAAPAPAAAAAAQELESIDALGYDPVEYGRLEMDLASMLTDLEGQPQLEPFKNEYETLFRALKKSHESESRLLKKCKELSADVTGHAHKVSQAARLSHEDQGAIANMRKDIERTWKAVEATHEREAHKKEVIAQLRQEIAQLHASMRQESEHHCAKETALRELVHRRDELVRERETVSAQISVGKADITDAQEKLRVVESERAVAEVASQKLRAQIDAKRSETEREVRRKERLEREAAELRARLEASNGEIRSKQQRLAEGAELLGRLDGAVREARAQVERESRAYEGASSRLSALQHELAAQVRANAAAAQEGKKRLAEQRQKAESVEAAKAEARRLERLVGGVAKKLAGYEAERGAAEAAGNQVRAQTAELERQLELLVREVAGGRKAREELVRERDLMHKSLLKAASATQRCAGLVRISENEKANLEHEMATFRASALRARRQIHALEHERDKHAGEALAASARHREVLDEVSRKEGAVLELQRQIGEAEGRVKTQQNLYEAVRADRNLYSKNLIEAQEEIGEMRRRFRSMSAQIEQLKDEIASKDSHLTREHFEHLRVDNERAHYSGQVEEARAKLGEAEAAVGGTQAEIAKLHRIIDEADVERAKQRKEYAVVVAERQALGAQLVKRDAELRALYEQIRSNQAMLRKGEAAYGYKLEDIGALKEQIYALRAEHSALRAAVGAEPNLKFEAVRLQRDVLYERTKVRALQEELEHPMNVHRWRKLESSEPAVYAMVLRIHSLQRRLVAKSDAVEQTDGLIQQKEKLYLELKNILARQPGPEVAEQLAAYQSALADKGKQLKAMNAELGAFRAQVADLKAEAAAVHARMAELKRRYFATQMRERKRHSAADAGDALAELDRRHEAALSAHLSSAGAAANATLELGAGDDTGGGAAAE